MKVDTSPDRNFIERLKAIRWFQRCEQSPDGLHLKFSYRQIQDRAEVDENIKSLTWENFTLEASNRLTSYLHHNRNKEYQAWNTITDAYKKELPFFESQVQAFAETNGIACVLDDFNCIVLGMCMENHYYKIAPHLPIFFQYLLPLYEKGHIPCGWQGEVEEEFTGKPVDLTKGIPLIY